jgi:hypothetical protein
MWWMEDRTLETSLPCMYLSLKMWFSE